MTNSKRTASLDDVLVDYERASQAFDAKVLQTFINEYPQHADALRRYAHVQLTFVPATAEEIERESLSDTEMLPRQSKLLQRLQLLRGTPSASDTSEALDGLASISGENAIQAAASAVFGSAGHGEDMLLLCVVDSPSEVQDVPDWFFENLGEHIHVSPAAVAAAMAMKRQQSHQPLRFSSPGKPIAPESRRWNEVLQECITDDTIQSAILARGSRP